MRHLSLLAILSACGGGSENGGAAPLTPSEAAVECQAVCDHMVTCGWTTDATACAADCAADAPLFRGDGMRAWLDCIVAASCDTPNAGEGCYVEVTVDLDARAPHDAYVTSCQAVATDCPDTVLPGSVCELEEVIMFSDEYMTGSVLPCFDLACAEISACLETNVLDAF